MLISILTAVHQPGSGFLRETLASIEALRLPQDWELEWILQEDGPSSEIAAIVSESPRIKYAANGAKLGIAGTRNLGLNRAEGELVQVLDADDLLLPDAFTTLIPAFSDRTIHWALGQADDLLPDGSRKSFPPYPDLPFGRVTAGAVNDWAFAHQGSWPLHCAGLMMRTASVRLVGGWGGLPTDDDLIMFAGLSGMADGHFDERHTWLYRQHPDQTVRSTHHRTWSDHGRRMALQRAVAVRNSGLRLGPAVPNDDSHAITIAPSLKAITNN
ncbi:glycosyltransferase family 2 protein [Nocardia sp. NPDC051321]|uniref:glycosyltransferase family 2 protein n=1 Tax=Nocardia sp. NPDC051321 TaxID=3364323 RepID=UPI00379A430A